MSGKVNWHGDRVRRQIEAEVDRRLKACGQVGADHAKTLISVDGTGRALSAKVTLADLRAASGNKNVEVSGKIRKGALVYNWAPSRPGEPPRVQRGRLRASVAYEVAEQVARIGTNVKYGRILELGSSKMAPRPWLRRMLVEMTPTFRAILTAPIRGSR